MASIIFLLAALFDTRTRRLSCLFIVPPAFSVSTNFFLPPTGGGTSLLLPVLIRRLSLFTPSCKKRPPRGGCCTPPRGFFLPPPNNFVVSLLYCGAPPRIDLILGPQVHHLVTSDLPNITLVSQGASNKLKGSPSFMFRQNSVWVNSGAPLNNGLLVPLNWRHLGEAKSNGICPKGNNSRDWKPMGATTVLWLEKNPVIFWTKRFRPGYSSKSKS